jgi:outer membrane protein TolC
MMVRVAVLDGGRRESHQAAALAEVRKEELRATELWRDVELEVRRALEKPQMATGKIAAAGESLDLANQELEHARRRYEAGLITSIEVVEAQARVARAADNRIEGWYRRGQAIAEAAAAMGVCDSLF